MARKFSERRDLVPILGELFREHGFAGTSLSIIMARTGLGKGSLYHFFPDGKQGMADAVLDDVATWFEDEVFTPLRESRDPAAGIERMFEATVRFFQSGRRICLVGTFALDDTRDRFASIVQGYFAAWRDALATALRRRGYTGAAAREIAEDILAGIQGALVLARSQDDPQIFMRAVQRLRNRALVTAYAD